MKKELIILIGIFLFLAIGMHFKEWTSYPIEHLMALPHSSSYGLGWEHPIVYTLIVYILIAIPRGIKKLFSKNTK
ncbi:MAG: hypothetical protein U9O56_05970 [Campylobacterota bacterium]|nr:hypothetical protein [Campylobacterota bacterium]